MMHSDETFIPMTNWQLDVEAPVEVESGDEIHLDGGSAGASPSQSLRPDDATPPPLPRILEALFFAANEPLTIEKITQIIRGITAADISATVADLNQHYKKLHCPYHIQLHSTGYRLALRSRYRPLLEHLFGSVKEVRFSQLAIETLAIIAYRQPISATATEAILGQECSNPLRQLLRRGMVQLGGKNEQAEVVYSTTPRFLEFFQLSKVDDLPRADDLERL
jgi:segregation and condensation protein B